jgi:hypothetical protein
MVVFLLLPQVDTGIPPRRLESLLTLLLETQISHEITLLLCVTVIFVFECCDTKMCEDEKMALSGGEWSVLCFGHFFLRKGVLGTQ